MICERSEFTVPHAKQRAKNYGSFSSTRRLQICLLRQCMCTAVRRRYLVIETATPPDDLDARPCAQSCHVFRGSRFRAKMRKGTQENVITRVYHSARAREGIAFAAVNGTSERAASELRGKLSCDHRWTACGGETNQSARATGLRCVRSAPTRSHRVRHRSISFKMVLD